MGTDTPIAVLSDRPRLLFDYFQQLFAQVTNPPLDAIREELVTSLSAHHRPRGQPARARRPQSCRQIELPFPILDNDELAKLLHIDDDGDRARASRPSCIDGLYPVAGGGDGAARGARRRPRRGVSRPSPRASASSCSPTATPTRELAPIPSLLLTSAVHHHLIREKTRTQVGPRRRGRRRPRGAPHGAAPRATARRAINPYLAFESIEDLIARGLHGLGGVDRARRVKNYIKAAGKGVLKVMSKMGISTVASYTGAQVFEAIGLGQELVDEYFTGTVVAPRRHRPRRARRRGRAPATAIAYPDRPEERAHRDLELGGEYQWRREGEYHLFNPETVFKLQHATRAKRYDVFKEYTRAGRRPGRSAWPRCAACSSFSDGVRQPVPIDEVEPVSEIVKRFATGAMSLRLDLEGGARDARHRHEPHRRQVEHRRGRRGRRPLRARRQRRPAPLGDQAGGVGPLRRHAASTSSTPTTCRSRWPRAPSRARAASCPGHKVYPWIAKTRHSTPGVGLISPPPHHDIYSIEDLEQLIHDLKNSNPAARVHVKLVAEVGVGTVAAGVSKAHADVVLISGPRRRHRRVAAHVAQARRRAVGARPGRDAADAAAQRPARPHRRAGRRPAEDRPRRRHRRAARRRGVRLRHRAARRERAAS